ncbi:uncharacterized protein LOC144708925 [Wolffia australiana]
MKERGEGQAKESSEMPTDDSRRWCRLKRRRCDGALPAVRSPSPPPVSSSAATPSSSQLNTTELRLLAFDDSSSKNTVEEETSPLQVAEIAPNGEQCPSEEEEWEEATLSFRCKCGAEKEFGYRFFNKKPARE